MSAAIDYRNTSLLWAGPDQAAELAAAHAGLFPDAWDAAAFEKLLSHPGSIAFIARVGSPLQLAGFVLAQMAADEAEILTVGVPAAHQGHGVGRRLVEAICRSARKSEVRKLFLEVSAANTAATKLYDKAGFTRVGERKGYYQRQGRAPQDAVVMALDL